MALFDAFLEIEGIKGESDGAIQVESFSWGVSNQISRETGGGAGTGKPVFQDFSFTARLGKQSPELFLSAVQGTNFSSAELNIIEQDRKRQVTLSFFDVFISSYKEGNVVGFLFDKSENGGVPLEMVSLNFAQVQIRIGEIK
jgi:type VI secretion system secreted protein Hcp